MRTSNSDTQYKYPRCFYNNSGDIYCAIHAYSDRRRSDEITCTEINILYIVSGHKAIFFYVVLYLFQCFHWKLVHKSNLLKRDIDLEHLFCHIVFGFCCIVHKNHSLVCLVKSCSAHAKNLSFASITFCIAACPGAPIVLRF